MSRKPKSLCLLLLMASLAVGQNGSVPPAYFGMHDNNQDFTGSNYPIVSFGTFRIWDKEPINWYEVETARGVYNWAAFDTIMNKLTANGVTDVLYTFGYTPLWATGGAGSIRGTFSCLPPTSNQDMIDFITTLATRYNGRIKHYEVWNEPSGTDFWCGTLTQLVQVQNDVYTTVKAIDPTATIHTPVIQMSATGGDCNGGGTYGLTSFVNALGNNSKFDVVDAHLYPYPDSTYPEVSPGTDYIQIANLKCGMAALGISSKPIWNTEFDAGFEPVSSDRVAFLARAYLYFWSQGVARSYWYAYDNASWGQLFNGTSLTASGVAYQQVYNWMVGSTMTTPCATQSGTIWTCTLTRPNGYQALAVWNTAGSSTYTPPTQYTQYKDLAGATRPFTGSMTIGIEPILLENPTAPSPPTGLTGTVQ
jgi:hypothetical protein